MPNLLKEFIDNQMPEHMCDDVLEYLRNSRALFEAPYTIQLELTPFEAAALLYHLQTTLWENHIIAEAIAPITRALQTNKIEPATYDQIKNGAL